MISILTLFLILGTTFGMRVPAEWEPHQQTFLVWPQSSDIWFNVNANITYLTQVRADISRIAKAILRYEQITIIVDPGQVESAKTSFTEKESSNISYFPTKVNDPWARDTLPVFGVDEDSKSLVGIDLNFNRWGEKQEHKEDSKLAEEVLQDLKVKRIVAKVVGEGGALEFDGEGTLLITESSIVNTNRNPELTRDEIETKLKSVFKMEKVIWFDGVEGKDITDEHVDTLVRFVKPGVVILNRPFPKSVQDVCSIASDQAKLILDNETDSKGRKLRVVELFEPDPDQVFYPKNGLEDEFLASYVNFLVINGAVIVPQFGDEKADSEARKVLGAEFPGRDVIPVSISYLAEAAFIALQGICLGRMGARVGLQGWLWDIFKCFNLF